MGILVGIPWIRFDFIELTSFCFLFLDGEKGMLDHEVIVEGFNQSEQRRRNSHPQLILVR